MALNSKILFFSLLVLLLVACKPTELNTGEYVNYIKDPANGLKDVKTIDEYKVSIQYKPLNYVVLLERNGDKLSANDFTARKKAITGAEYFTMRIESKDKTKRLMDLGVNDQTDFSNKINYFTFEMQNDLFLKIDKDTIPCSLFQYVRDFDLTPHSEFVLAFSKKTQTEITEDMELIFNDSYLGIGTLKFVLRKEDIINIPELKF